MPEYDSTIVYRPIPSLPETFYRAGSDGSIWSCQKTGKNAGKVGEWRRLKTNKAGRGYLCVRLGINGRHRGYYVHRLVLEAFIGPCPYGMEGCHNNGDLTDNRAVNLRWDTTKNNQADRVRHGTDVRGSKTPWAVLKEEDIPVIRSRLAGGESVTVVAEDYAVNSATISDVGRGKTWKHVAS